MSAARLAYSALVYALLPAALVRLYWRARREPGYHAHVAERFGYYPGGKPAAPIIWLHAVSVGETRAAEPLVRALAREYPGHTVLITHMTPTGRATGETLFGPTVLRAYLPYDFPGGVARFLEHYRPRAGILLETEIWPNLVQACKARGIPLYLVNARLSAKSSRGYARFASLVREAFGSLTAVAAQAEDDAQRLRALGARRVEVTGNLKFDVTIPPGQLELGRQWRTRYGPRPVLLAASTRDGEEALLLDAARLLPPEALLVIVPRHPQRFDAVAQLIDNRGFRFQRRSREEPPGPDTRVILGDSMGEMAAYYASCDLALIGGSLLPFGAHNLIEACAIGKPLLLGPHTYNFAEAAEQAVEVGAALRVESAEHFAAVAADLLGNPAALSRMGQRGLAWSRVHQGATGRVMAIVKLRD